MMTGNRHNQLHTLFNKQAKDVTHQGTEGFGRHQQAARPALMPDGPPIAGRQDYPPRSLSYAQAEFIGVNSVHAQWKMGAVELK